MILILSSRIIDADVTVLPARPAAAAVTAEMTDVTTDATTDVMPDATTPGPGDNLL